VRTPIRIALYAAGMLAVAGFAPAFYFGLRLSRGAFGRRGLFDFPATARFLRAASLGLLGPALRLFGLLLVAGPFLLCLIPQARLFGFGGLTQPCLFFFGCLPQTRLFRFEGGAHTHLLFCCGSFSGDLRFTLGFSCRGSGDLRFYGGSFSCDLRFPLGFSRGGSRDLRLALGFRRSGSRDRLIVLLNGTVVRGCVGDSVIFRELLGADLGGARQIAAQFLGEDGLIAAGDRFGLLLATEAAEQPAGARFFAGDRACQHRHRVRLDVFDAFQTAEMSDQLLFVSRRHQRREQDHIRYSLRDRGDGGIARIDDLDFTLDLLLHQVAQQRGLARIGCEREYQWHRRPTFSP
jgi:hypothetical protein